MTVRVSDSGCWVPEEMSFTKIEVQYQEAEGGAAKIYGTLFVIWANVLTIFTIVQAIQTFYKLMTF